MPDGDPVRCIRLVSGDCSCEVITYGAALRSLRVPSKDGMVDVVLGYDSLEEYLNRSGRFGAVMGRCANRISHAFFELNGKSYELPKNRGEHHIHGGKVGFDKRNWSVSSVSGNSVTLWLVSPDGEEGYPGKMGVSVTYTLDGSTLRIDYLAHSDADTVCNLTNHSYFNLGGSGDITDHEVALYCSRFTPADSEGIPDGSIASVEGTRLDLRERRRLADIMGGGGFDQNFLTDSEKIASVWCSRTGITMDVVSDFPAVQFYTGNGIKADTPGKDGAVYSSFSGMCFEAQYCPDSPNRPEFPSVILGKDGEFRHFVEYRFGC